MTFFTSPISLVQNLRKWLKLHCYSLFMLLAEAKERVPIAVAVSVRKNSGGTIKAFSIGQQPSTFAQDHLKWNLNQWPKTQKVSIKSLAQRLLITECIRGLPSCILHIFTHSTILPTANSLLNLERQNLWGNSFWRESRLTSK